MIGMGQRRGAHTWPFTPRAKGRREGQGGEALSVFWGRTSNLEPRRAAEGVLPSQGPLANKIQSGEARTARGGKEEPRGEESGT